MDKDLINELELVFVTRKECEDVQESYNIKLNDTIVSLTKIETKMNLLLGILSAIGVAVLGIALKFMFGA